MTRPAVLVTGGAKRIGAAIAQRFGEAGWHVVIHTHTPSPEADALVSALPSAETIACDLADGTGAVDFDFHAGERLVREVQEIAG